MKKSLLKVAVGKMMKQDEWANKYNPDNLFDVDQYSYDTKSEYLEALREEWKWDADPSDEFDDYIDVSKYNDFDSYQEAIEICQEKKSWQEEYDPYNHFDITPFNFTDENDYLSALRKEWKEKYDPYDDFEFIDPNDYNSASDYEEAIDEASEKKSYNEEHNSDDKFDVNPYNFDDKDDYLSALQEKWKEKFDPYDEFEDIEPDEYDNIDDYEKAINIAKEKNSWKEEYDPDNDFDIKPCDFKNENDYLVALKKQWKEEYDILDQYSYINPNDYDSASEYKEAIDVAEEHESFIEKFPNNFFKTNPYDFEKKSDYLSALLKEAEQKCKISYLFYDINKDDYNSTSEYKKAISKAKEQRSWKKRFDMENYYNVNPYKYKTQDKYIDALSSALKKKWKKIIDPNNEYKDINPKDFNDIYEYEKAIKKAKKQK